MWFVLLCCVDASIQCFSSFCSSSLTISPLNCVITSHSVSLAVCCCRALSCVSVPAGRSSCRWTVTPPSWTATGDGGPCSAQVENWWMWHYRAEQGLLSAAGVNRFWLICSDWTFKIEYLNPTLSNDGSCLIHLGSKLCVTATVWLLTPRGTVTVCEQNYIRHWKESFGSTLVLSPGSYMPLFSTEGQRLEMWCVCMHKVRRFNNCYWSTISENVCSSDLSSSPSTRESQSRCLSPCCQNGILWISKCCGSAMLNRCSHF